MGARSPHIASVLHAVRVNPQHCGAPHVCGASTSDQGPALATPLSLPAIKHSYSLIVHTQSHPTMHHPHRDVLQWACEGWEGAGPAQGPGPGAAAGRLKVAVRELGPGRGRGLQAVADAEAGEVLLSVPLTRVFSSEVRCACFEGPRHEGC